MKKHVIYVALAILIAGYTSVFGASPEDISGIYRCEGRNYKGTTIIKKSGDAYQLLWSIGTTTHQGVGLINGDYLSSSWLPNGIKAVPGIVVYKMLPGGILKGTFASYPGGGIETETLTYQAPVN